MPTYEYTCASCGHALEAFQNISEAPLQLCPHCKKPRLERGIGGGQAVLSKKASSTLPQASTCCPCGKSKCSK